jgi:hypothetical protein
MPTFTCYIHKPGLLKPELRVVACDREQDLGDAILAEAASWGEFEKIDVYTEAEERMFSFTYRAPASH